jgi:phage host-nuclease inhibitor protein Gam
MESQEILNKIRDLREETKELHNLMRENTEISQEYMKQLDEIDNEIIQLMDNFKDNVNGNTSTK